MGTEITKQNTQVQSKKYVLKKTKTACKYLINYQDELNESQLEAVKQKDGAILVIAGAGSGKTRTLVYRVARLIESGVNPNNILLLTFTKKSAQEMLSRASTILDTRCEDVQGGTFHSFANIILRKYSGLLGLNNSFTILDRADSEDIINLVRGKLVNTREKRFPRKKTILDIYSKSINKNIPAKNIIENEYQNFAACTDKILEICQEYNKYKRENSLLDYDDLLLYLKTLLTSNEKTRKTLSEKYKYIMIDEYQDTNSLQADIVRLLASEHNNVMAVGDDSQSIYSFRGANFKNIMNFPQIFENTKIIKLEENYRSSQNILNLTNEIIKQAKEKYTKNLFTSRGQGELPVVIATPNSQAEAEFITQRVLELAEEDIPLNDICVLARSARSTYALEMELNKRAIPFKKFGGYKFIETAHIKDVMAYLRVAINPQDQISWNRLLLLLKGVGAATGNKIIPYAIENDIENIKKLPMKSTIKDDLTKLFATIVNLKDKSPAEAINFVIDYYQPILADKYDDYQKREKDLENFIYLAEPYGNLEKFISDLALEAPDSSVIGVNENNIQDEYLTISTIHSAKGLEWDSVFIMGAVEGRFPSLYSFNSDDEIEEERRLMYVATTRAKNNLHISYPIDMFDYSTGMVLSKPSRFIEDISENLLERWHLEEED